MRHPIRWLTLGIATVCLCVAGVAAAGPRGPKPALKPVSMPLWGSPAALFDPPSNDLCSGAITILCGNISLSGNTFTATNNYDFVDTTLSCTGYSAGGRDVVYRLDAQAGDSIWVRYQSTDDASMYIVTDCAHVQDSCKAGMDENHQGQYEELRYGFPRTGTYYLILDSYGADTYGTWTLVGQFFSCGLHPPVNDRCETATTLFCSSFLYTGDTNTAQDDYSFPTVGGSCMGSRALGRDVLFRLNVTAGDSLAATYTSTADGVMYIMPECTPSGTPVNCLVGANATGPGGTEAINYRFAYTGTYYLVLDSDGPGTDGGWSLSGGLVCGLNVPTNDQCAGATYLPCGGFELSGDNSLAFPDYDPTEAGCTGFGALGSDVVFRIDAAPGDSLWCDYVFPHVTSDEDVDASLYLVTDCSLPDSFCVAGSDTVGAAQIEHMTYKFTQRGTYYLVLDSYDPGLSGVWSAVGGFICPQALGVGDHPVAGQLSLAASIPNPFEHTTTMRFTVPVRSRATLRVFDLAGRVVRTLFDADMEAGSRQINWDARDDRGNRVSGGTYFARLVAGDRVAKQTLILLH